MNAKNLRKTGEKLLNKDKNEEIKEILEDIKRHLDYVEATKQSSIRDNEMKVMYDYITNLQEEKDKEIERLNNIIGKAIHYINLNQDSKSLCLNYEQLKALRGILRQDEFYLMLFENQLKELKGSVDE